MHCIFSVDFFHIPAALSFPHFYLASDRYKTSVYGLNPNTEEHQTIIDADPVEYLYYLHYLYYIVIIIITLYCTFTFFKNNALYCIIKL